MKELEAILRRRNPNSLPALLYAAAAADGGGAHGQGGEPPTQTAALLERRVHRLEAELEGKDEDAKRSLRTMEQQFQRIKVQHWILTRSAPHSWVQNRILKRYALYIWAQYWIRNTLSGTLSRYCR